MYMKEPVENILAMHGHTQIKTAMTGRLQDNLEKRLSQMSKMKNEVIQPHQREKCEATFARLPILSQPL